MKRTTRQFIRGLRKTFRETDKNGRQEIWDILTALRGPDYISAGVYSDKSATTAVIRSEVFGFNLLKNVPADVHKDTKDRKDHRLSSDFLGTHFASHARSAFKTLGLKWDEVNE